MKGLGLFVLILFGLQQLQTTAMGEKETNASHFEHLFRWYDTSGKMNYLQSVVENTRIRILHLKNCTGHDMKLLYSGSLVESVEATRKCLDFSSIKHRGFFNQSIMTNKINRIVPDCYRPESLELSTILQCLDKETTNTTNKPAKSAYRSLVETLIGNQEGRIISVINCLERSRVHLANSNIFNQTRAFHCPSDENSTNYYPRPTLNHTTIPMAIDEHSGGELEDDLSTIQIRSLQKVLGKRRKARDNVSNRLKSLGQNEDQICCGDYAFKKIDESANIFYSQVLLCFSNQSLALDNLLYISEIDGVKKSLDSCMTAASSSPVKQFACIDSALSRTYNQLDAVYTTIGFDFTENQRALLSFANECSNKLISRLEDFYDDFMKRKNFCDSTDKLFKDFCSSCRLETNKCSKNSPS